MAALYLHHALFAADPQPPPSNARTLHDRQSSSFSTVTLRTTSDYTHPTESLLQHDEPTIGSSAYLDILARQPLHPAEPRASWNTSLSLQPDPITPRERKRIKERALRRKLRRLRWAKWILLIVAAFWAIYNAIRYFLAFSIYLSSGRQQASLALGILSALSLVLLVSSAAAHVFLPHLGRSRGSSAGYPGVQILLEYTSSASLLSPAITNLVLVCVWRHSQNPFLTVEGRCTWDIDVVWSRAQFRCQSPKAIAWGYWLAGAVVRLTITSAVLFTYHLLSHKYDALASRSSRRKGGRTHTHSVSYPSVPGREPSLSIRSSRTMLSSTTIPVSLARSGHQPSQTASSERQSAGGSRTDINVPGRRSLYRASSTRISSEQLSGDGHGGHSRHSQQSSEGHIAVSSAVIDDERVSLESFEEEDALSQGDNDAYSPYGRPIRHSPGAYLIAPDNYTVLEPDTTPTATALPGDDLHGFVDRFRSLLEEVTRDTEADIDLARSDQLGYYSDGVLSSPSADSEDASDIDYVPIVGSLIQRMPTIESLGSREVMSLAASSVQRGDRSVHSLSRPPTRANTLSQPPSRSNSLTASVILTTPTEAQPPGSELVCQMSKAPNTQGGSSCGSRNSTPYYPAGGTGSNADTAATTSNGSRIVWPSFHRQSHTCSG
ncbi:hypothetical protein NM688_g1369 [Phlebia brevispora]|uniref:Uncharacterized protein n=1 Tax=Phlebia brevispora TaxID=194682 RepID=A0ACC1TBI0_9APHY|nr:hypothetical protein NM688_g1369 [Phlebia brevispora]